MSTVSFPVGAPTLLCSNCGTPIDGTKGLTQCYDCIKLNYDITQEVPREATVNFCRNCERYLYPPQQWIFAQLESRELLALLLKRLKGLSKVRLTDARFIWTEPHSRRIRVKLTVQGEPLPSVIIQQSFEVEFVVIATQCPDCAKSFTVHTWTTCIQIRQKVPHKRTFFYLEQLILKHNAHQNTNTIKESRDGIDFFYSSRTDAAKMLDFLNAVVPTRSKRSEELISTDTHSGSSTYKFTHSVEIVPICRDDMVVLPAKIANALGQISQTVICSRISNTVQFLDPNTLQVADIPAGVYWQAPFPALANSSQLTEFIVIDLEPVGIVRGKYALADVVVARSADFGRNDQQFSLRTHLGGILHPGDSALGYFLLNTNYNNEVWDSLPDYKRPDVVLVKKHYPYKRRTRNRNWKLKRMAKEYNEESFKPADVDRVERDYEMFLRELEEDKELRETVNLYKGGVPKDEDEMSDDDGDAPVIPVDELLDDFDNLGI